MASHFLAFVLLGVLLVLGVRGQDSETCEVSLPELSLEGAWMKSFLVCTTNDGDQAYWDISFSTHLNHVKQPVMIGYAFGENCNGDTRDIGRVAKHLVRVTGNQTVAVSTEEMSYQVCIVAYCEDQSEHCTFGLSGKTRPTGGDVPTFIIIGGILLGGGLLLGVAWMYVDRRRRKKRENNADNLDTTGAEAVQPP